MSGADRRLSMSRRGLLIAGTAFRAAGVYDVTCFSTSRRRPPPQRTYPLDRGLTSGERIMRARMPDAILVANGTRTLHDGLLDGLAWESFADPLANRIRAPTSPATWPRAPRRHIAAPE